MGGKGGQAVLLKESMGGKGGQAESRGSDSAGRRGAQQNATREQLTAQETPLSRVCVCVCVCVCPVRGFSRAQLY